MNILDTILITDTNVIIHLEKAGLLDEFVNDDRIRIADLVYFQEYEKNGMLKNISKSKLLTLNEKQISI